MKRNNAAFILIELLAVVAIVCVLVAVLFAAAPHFIEKGKITASLNNLREIGVAFQAFTNEHEMQLPTSDASGDKWPKRLSAYLSAPKVYADPGDVTNYLRRATDPLSNSSNNTSYVMNGFNDMGTYGQPDVKVRTLILDAPGQTILLSPAVGHSNFYMDSDSGNLGDVPDKKLFTAGSTYLFADGSVQFIKAADYRDELWLAHKSPL